MQVVKNEIKRVFLDMQKLYEIQISLSVKLYWNTAVSVYVLPMAVCILQQHCGCNRLYALEVKYLLSYLALSNSHQLILLISFLADNLKRQKNSRISKYVN